MKNSTRTINSDLLPDLCDLLTSVVFQRVSRKISQNVDSPGRYTLKLRVKPNTKAMLIQIPLISSGEGGVKWTGADKNNADGK